MTEESKSSSWVWKAFREILKFVGAVLLVMFIWFFDQETEPISEIIKKIQNLRFPQDYYIFVIVTLALYLSGKALGTRRARKKAERLPQSQDVPGVIHIGKFEIKIEDDLLLFSKKGSLKSRSWTERRSEFRGVRLSGKYVVSAEAVDYLEYIIELLYLEKSETIILCKEGFSSIEEFISIRKTWKETARALDLPAVEKYPWGFLWREVQDLDKPIRDLAKEDRISFHSEIDLHLPSRTKLSQRDEELTVICSTGLLHKIEIIISPIFISLGDIIIRFDEMQYIGPLKHIKSSWEYWNWKSHYTLVVASDSEIFDMNGLSYDQVSWLGRLILAGACGKLKSPIYVEQNTFS